VTAFEARFLAEVIDDTTMLVVESGEVEVRSPSGLERVRSPARRAWNRQLQVAALTPQTCTAETAATRITCLEREAAGAGLTAQAASFDLGLAYAQQGDGPRAVAAWRQSLRRFENGVLAPEVRLALVSELARQGLLSEARAVAQSFLEAYPEDPRASDVRAFQRRF
jgi:TolA-binding protein